MENVQITDLNFFIFLIPGFLMVWCFKKFTHKTINNDFELVGLSVFWGLINLILWWLTSPKEAAEKALKNVYSSAFILCLFAVLFSYIGAWIALQNWWLSFKKALKPRTVSLDEIKSFLKTKIL